MHSIIFRLACCRDKSEAGICSHVSCGAIVLLQRVYLSQRERGREDFSPTMSKITHFFAPTSSGSGKRSNASSTSGNNNKDEEDEPLEPPVRAPKETCWISSACSIFLRNSFNLNVQILFGIRHDSWSRRVRALVEHYLLVNTKKNSTL